MGVEIDDRGQSGLDRLVLFVLLLVAILLVAPPALEFGGIDVREPQTGTPVPVELTVIGAEGTAIDDGRSSVGTVRVVLANTGQPDVDMSEFTVTWVGNGTHTLVPAGSDREGDGEFTVGRLDDEQSGTVLSSVDERGVLEFDLGTDDVEGIEPFGQRLRPGERVTVTLTTSDGMSETKVLLVPDRLPANGSVSL